LTISEEVAQFKATVPDEVGLAVKELRVTGSADADKINKSAKMVLVSIDLDCIKILYNDPPDVIAGKLIVNLCTLCDRVSSKKSVLYTRAKSVPLEVFKIPSPSLSTYIYSGKKPPS